MKDNNKVKWYGVVIGVVTALAQHGIYSLGNIIGQWVGIAPYSPKIDCLDNLFVLIPVFIVPYVWAYLYWAMAPAAVSKCEKKHFQDYLVAYGLACVLGMLILIFAPTYMDRVAEGLMDTSEYQGFFADWMRFWYSLDGGDRAYNLLPSFHCIVSTVSYLGVAGRKEIPFWYRAYSLVITVIIFFSTLFVKQHYIADVFAGIAVAVVAWVVVKRLHLGKILDRPMRWVENLGNKK